MRDLFGTDTRFAGTRCKEPRRGGLLCGASQGRSRQRLRRAGTGRRLRRPNQSSGEEAPVKSGPSANGDAPLEGEKLKGGTSRRFAGATDFRGEQSPGGERGIPRAKTADPIEPTPGGQAQPRGGAMPREGKPSKSESHERYRLKQGDTVSGGRKRQESAKL